MKRRSLLKLALAPLFAPLAKLMPPAPVDLGAPVSDRVPAGDWARGASEGPLCITIDYVAFVDGYASIRYRVGDGEWRTEMGHAPLRVADDGLCVTRIGDVTHILFEPHIEVCKLGDGAQSLQGTLSVDNAATGHGEKRMSKMSNESVRETSEILADRALMEDLHESIQQMNRGETLSLDDVKEQMGL